MPPPCRRQAPADSHLGAEGFDWKPRTLAGRSIMDGEINVEGFDQFLDLEGELSLASLLEPIPSTEPWAGGGGRGGGPRPEAASARTVHIPLLNLALIGERQNSSRGSVEDFPDWRPSTSASVDVSADGGEGGLGGSSFVLAPYEAGRAGVLGTSRRSSFSESLVGTLNGGGESSWPANDSQLSLIAALRPDVIASHQSVWGHMSEGERVDAARYYARLSGLYTERLGMVRGWTRLRARIASAAALRTPSEPPLPPSFVAGLREAVEGARCSSSEAPRSWAHDALGEALPDPRPATTGAIRCGKGGVSVADPRAALRAASAAVSLPNYSSDFSARVPARSPSGAAAAAPHGGAAAAAEALPSSLTPKRCLGPPSCPTPRSARFDSPSIASLASSGYVAVPSPVSARGSEPATALLPPQAGLRLGLPSGAPGWVARLGPPSPPRARLHSGLPASRRAGEASWGRLSGGGASAWSSIEGGSALRLAPHSKPASARGGWHTCR